MSKSAGNDLRSAVLPADIRKRNTAFRFLQEAKKSAFFQNMPLEPSGFYSAGKPCFTPVLSGNTPGLRYNKKSVGDGVVL